MWAPMTPTRSMTVSRVATAWRHSPGTVSLLIAATRQLQRIDGNIDM